MDSIIPIGQKNTLAEYMILSGAENRPPMLDKDLYDSWKSIMELYMQNKENKRMILESVKHGLLIWPTIKENGIIRTKKYAELSATEKIQVDCDLKATNIILQGLPSDIYSLVNHHRVAKDLWEKLVKDLHTTNFDQLHAYLEQHELHANEVRLMRERNAGLTVPVFKQEDDPIDAINKMMSFLSTVVTSRFLSTNNQLRNSSNPRQQATIHDGRVTIQPLQGRQNSYVAATSGTRANTSGTGRNYSGQQRVVKCFNCQGEGHMARQCPKPKRKRDATWFREKVLLVEAQGNGKVLNKEELEFLADPILQKISTAKAVLMANVSSYRSDVLSKKKCSKAVLTANLSSYGSNVLSENKIHSDSNIIPYSQYLIELQNVVVQDTSSSTQQDALILSMFEQLSNQVTNYNKVNNDNLIANETLSAELKRYKEQVKLLEERQKVDLGTRQKLIIDDIIQEKNAQFMNFEKEINNLKQTISKQSMEKEFLTKTFNVLKNESKEKEAQNIDTEIALEKKVKELDNVVCKMGQSAQMLTKPQVFYDNNLKQALGFQNLFYLKKAQQIRPMLYDDNVIAKETNVISIADSEETLMLEEESRSKMLLKQRKYIVDNAAQVSNATIIALGMYKLDPVILAPMVKNNREAHEYYLKHTIEQAAIIRELIQELLGNIPKVPNRPLLSSTGVNPYTSASRSKPSGNTKNERITRTPSSNEKNKVEVQSRKVKSSLNKRNSESKNVCNEHVKHGAKALCSVCNECLFDANHVMCLIDHVNSMNVHAKSVSNKNKRRKEWKPTGKVFNSIGYKWKPTGRTFTLVGNACPLTRLTATNKVPLRVPIPLEVVAPKQVVTRVYTRRPKVPKSVQNSKPKVAKSMTTNRMELDTSRGSDTSIAPSSSEDYLITYLMRKREFLQNILDLYFKHFKLSEDVVNRILQVVLDLQHFKSSLFIFAATILQSSSAIHHISNIDNYVHQIIKFQSILITSSHSLWSSQSFGHQKGVCPWLTENHFNSQYMKHWASQSFGT
ncbi:retrovirus-related pol polyprotein from transposon TNT 1-94 [Tanacetum coccineum]